MMPPSKRVLLNKIRRAKFVPKIWMSSIKTSPPNDSPLDSGWKLVDRNYQLLWSEGDLSPSSLDIIYECEKHDRKYCMFRNSRPEVFCKKCVLRNSAKFTGKHLCQSLFFNNVAQVFSCEFCEISKNTFSYRTPPMAASVCYCCRFLILFLLHF